MKRFLAGAATLACALACIGAGSAHAAAPHNGYGFAIAEDAWDWSNPGPTPQLGENFARLAPKSFRLQVDWNADVKPEHMFRVRTLIDHVRLQGVQNVVVTFTNTKDDDDDDEGAAAPSASVYEQHVDAIVDQLASRVDVWGPANEPNLNWLPGTAGAQKLAAYNQALADVVAVRDASATRTSPDFHDTSSLSSLTSYVNAYKAAGGGGGHVVAFHPYLWASAKSDGSVDEIAALFPGKNVWLTELGSFITAQAWGIFNRTEAEQAEKLSWIVNTLSQHPRVERVYYYHLRGGAADWDTALMRSDLTRRPSWYLWCAASHGGNGSHPDCAPPSAPNGGSRMGVAAGNGSVWLKEGLPGGPWLLMGGTEFLTVDVELDGNRMAVVMGNGSVWLKDGLPGAVWTIMGGAEFQARDVELDGNRMVVAMGNGSVWLKNGLPGATWEMLGGTQLDARDVEIDANRVAVRSGSGSVWLNDGLLPANWHQLGGPEFGARDVELEGNRVVVAMGMGAVWVKEGLPGGPWTGPGGPEFDARDVELLGGRIAVIAGNGSVWLKDGLPGGPWLPMGGTEFAARKIELKGNRLGVAMGNGSVWLKDGLPGATWGLIAGPEFDARDIALP